jgi:UDP-N-acetylglucosamine/UDP-N-acetylgalactosamine 4-epimerase
MSTLDEVLSQLTRQPRHWLVTGAAGFIASNLVEFLLRHGQRVTGLDDFSTGHRHNLDEVPVHRRFGGPARRLPAGGARS